MTRSVRILLLLVLSCLLAHEASAQQLTIVIRNIRDGRGQVGAALFDNEKDFLKNNIATKSAKAAPGEIRLVFDKITAGDYAVSVLHDLNGNGDMDSDFLGIPKEGFGFSNDAMGPFGPPKFQKAKFHFFGQNQTIVITMKYI